MRIVHLRSSEFLGSPEKLIIGQITQLTEFDCCVATFSGRQNCVPFTQACKRAGIDSFEIKESFLGDWRVIGQLRKLFYDRQIDLVVTHDYKSNFFAHHATRNSDVRQIALFHGVTSEDSKVSLYNSIDRWTLKRVDHIITVSEKTARLIASFGIKPSNISVVPNAIDENILIDNLPVRDSSDQVQLVAAGRLSYEKGFDLLLEAIAEIAETAEPFKLYLYGSGPEETKLRQIVADLQIEPQIEFCGFTDKLIEIFDRMDLMIMSSRSEGMPVVLLEAWARKLPVLATTVGGIPELINHGKNGLLVEPENIEALAEAISSAIKDRPKLKALGEAGYQLVKADYTYRSQTKSLAKIYRNYKPAS
ncbi:MAG: glycosyltransferase family 4 protein [candidate division Zixibacteria bacterium]